VYCFFVASPPLMANNAKGPKFKEAGGGLGKAGMLEREANTGRLQLRLRIGGSQQRFYKVKLLDAVEGE
ncbi:hypothetical protein, partial [Escherichia coli]|uniref:hypothetical protein n=1 Tax=Escherichia coli TaxID=562 RepID=UPI00384BD10B